jgi:hypothetical protein
MSIKLLNGKNVEYFDHNKNSIHINIHELASIFSLDNNVMSSIKMGCADIVYHIMKDKSCPKYLHFFLVVTIFSKYVIDRNIN